jgi:hypothetical protein
MFESGLEWDGWPVTRVDKASDAYAVARSCLHPLVVVVDYHILQFQNFVELFTQYADQMPRMEWVVFGCKHEDMLDDEKRAFIAARVTKTYPWTFNFMEVLQAIWSAAERLPGDGISGATKGDPGGSPDTR